MDMRMPHMDGLEATKAIRALEREDAKQIPIIAMTADAFEESVKAAKEAGMDGYVTKPVIPAKLFEELSKHLKS
jgi:CheY-like chemotaxis protein